MSQFACRGCSNLYLVCICCSTALSMQMFHIFCDCFLYLGVRQTGNSTASQAASMMQYSNYYMCRRMPNKRRVKKSARERWLLLKYVSARTKRKRELREKTNKLGRLGVEGDALKKFWYRESGWFSSISLSGFNKLLNDVFCLLFCGVNIPFLLIYVLDN